jgi:hypothetical protein
MAYTLGEAAKATGKSKTSVRRALDSGRISASKNALGEWQIEPSELHRVYPVMQPVPVTGGTPSGAGGNGEFRGQIEVLERENALLREQLGREREISSDLQQDRDHWRQQATALLTDQREKSPQKPVEGRLARAWGILRGKS